MAEALLSLQDILVRHQNATILQVPSLEVHRGEVLAVIGPNGAGKSTLLRVMGLLQQPARGKVYFQGKEVTGKNALVARRRMAHVFQEPLLLNASVYDNAALGLRLRGLDRGSARPRVKPWLEKLGIAHLASRPARTLSGGEMQRTSLARALVLDPELLLLDEPFSALDPPTREALLLDLHDILNQTGTTTVLVTHDRQEAFMLGKRVGVLKGGKLFQVGSSLEVFTQPLHEEVAELVGIDTRIPGVVEANAGGSAKVRFEGGAALTSCDLRPGSRVILCIRSEDIALSRPGKREPERTDSNRITVKVAKVTPWALHYRLELRCGPTLLVASLSRTSFFDLEIREGDQLTASFSPAAVHVIRPVV